MRRLAPIIYAIVFFDALLLFAIVPLLPDYVTSLHLSKTQAGGAIGIYSAATLAVALPAGRIADRLGPRRITVAGVALMALSTLAYAGAHSFWVLLAARGGQGVASGISWTAGLAWLSSSAPPDRRGRVLGLAMTFGSVGALMGPVLAGPLAAWLGIRAPFVLLAAIAAVLTVASALPADVRGTHIEHVGLLDTLRIAVRGRLMACAVLVMVLVAAVSGVLDTLVPLRMGAAGYSATAISLMLALAGLASALTQGAVGRVYDSLGGLRIAFVSIAAMAVLTGLLAVPESALALAVIFVIGSPAVAAQYAISFPLAAEGADEVGLPHGIVLGAMNVCWGIGFFIGPSAGAAIAEASSDRVTYLLAALLGVVALPLLRTLALSPRECQESA
ncbi:MAG: transporter, family, putative family transporter protein [Gaiellales bacterium]|jgi:predicted MFS family arabinose efflux permease|nr:transporter, family, putative family transporter protein [Gaiellales bacterium]